MRDIWRFTRRVLVALMVCGLIGYAALIMLAQPRGEVEMHGIVVKGSDGRYEDQVVAEIASRLTAFWNEHPSVSMDTLTWRAHDHGMMCGMRVVGYHAGYCMSNSTVLWWHRAIKDELDTNGVMGVEFVIAHEVGHHVAPQLGIWYDRKSRLRGELMADCLAGVFQGNQRHVPGDIEKARRAVVARGESKAEGTNRHGTAEERVAAWERGMAGGVDACLAGA